MSLRRGDAARYRSSCPALVPLAAASRHGWQRYHHQSRPRLGSRSRVDSVLRYRAYCLGGEVRAAARGFQVISSWWLRAEDVRVSYRIGEVAERVGMTVEGLRFYERRGLLAPARRTS